MLGRCSPVSGPAGRRSALPGGSLFDHLVGARKASCTMSPSALAVLRLIASSNLIGSWTRSSLGSATRSLTSRQLSTTFSHGFRAPLRGWGIDLQSFKSCNQRASMRALETCPCGLGRDGRDRHSQCWPKGGSSRLQSLEPPSTAMASPFIDRASAETRNAMTEATSAACRST
jgi:hypothetical protein